MSLEQKKARENFKKAIAYRKKTGCTLKQAFAHVKGGKVTGVKKAVKKVAKKKAVPVSKHKDTKSHNVNIRVVSGIPKPIIKKIDQIIDEIKQREDVIEDVKKRKKQLIAKNGNQWYIKWMKDAKKIVSELKHHKTQLKKYI